MNTKKRNLIGLSGRSGNGKDLIGDIIQYLTANETQQHNIDVHDWDSNVIKSAGIWTVKKYADKLKDIVCLLIGCTREELEDREFKVKPLGEDWRIYERTYRENNMIHKELLTKERYDILSKVTPSVATYKTEILTPRTLLQKLGTECGRRIIHPNLWVNAMFSDYKAYFKGIANLEYSFEACYHRKACDNCNKPFLQHKRARFCDECILDDSFQVFPNWIVTDVRFPANEGKGITDRGGFIIGVKRKFSLRFPEHAALENPTDPYSIPASLKEINEDLYNSLIHESEELMGDFSWCDYVIENNGTKEELKEKVKEVLIQENLL